MRLGTRRNSSVDRMTVLISIEGGIGSGKSTVFRKLRQLLNHKTGIVFVEEPVEEWTQNGFLKSMYDGKMSKAAFQQMALMSLVGDLQKALASSPAVIISERSPFSNYHVFAKANIAGDEFNMYEFSWKKLLAGLPRDLNIRYILLDAPITTLKYRIAQRARMGEGNITTQYHENIKLLHDAWLLNMQNKITIDATNTEDRVYTDACIAVDFWLRDAADSTATTPLACVERLREIQMNHAVEKVS